MSQGKWVAPQSQKKKSQSQKKFFPGIFQKQYSLSNTSVSPVRKTSFGFDLQNYKICANGKLLALNVAILSWIPGTILEHLSVLISAACIIKLDA